MNISRLKRHAVLLATLGCTLSLAACGSTKHKSATSSSSEHSSLVRKNRQLKKELQHSQKKTSVSSTRQSSTNSASSTAVSNTNHSTNSDPKLADGTDVYSLPLSDPRNPDSYKQGELMDIAGDPKYHNPDGSMNAEGDALASSIEATFHQPQP